MKVSDLKIMKSPAGYYLGRTDENGHPYSRESMYYSNKNLAKLSLELTIAKKGRIVSCTQDRENLEWLVIWDLKQDNPSISISRGKKLLGFKSMNEMRDWMNNSVPGCYQPRPKIGKPLKPPKKP